jgi:hypothetical protein
MTSNYIFVSIDMVIFQLRTNVGDILLYLYLGGSMLIVLSFFRSLEEVEKRWISYNNKGLELKLFQVQ